MDIIHYYILSSEVSSPFSIRFAYLLQTGNCLLKCLTMAFIDFIFENCGSLACWEVATFGDFHYFHSLFFKAALVHVAMVPHPNGYLWLYSGYCTWKVDCNDELRLRASSAAPTEVPVVCICMYPQAAVPDLRWKLGLSGGCSTLLGSCKSRGGKRDPVLGRPNSVSLRLNSDTTKQPLGFWYLLYTD